MRVQVYGCMRVRLHVYGCVGASVHGCIQAYGVCVCVCACACIGGDNHLCFEDDEGLEDPNHAKHRVVCGAGHLED